MATKAKPIPKPLDLLPTQVYEKLCCPECSEPLLRTQNGWVCPLGLSHTRLIRDLGILERIDPVLPTDNTKPRLHPRTGELRSGRTMQLGRVLRLLKRLSRQGLIPRRMGCEYRSKRRQERGS